jgi:hypothetical protein
MKVIS